MFPRFALLITLTVSQTFAVWADDNYVLPDVPYPIENPPTEAKRLLGKILFWDEQLSTDNSIACGSCHMPAAGGADRRIGLHPGFDHKLGTKDDIRGSLGVIARDYLGQPIDSSAGLQVTERTAQPYFSGIWSPLNFWDGRASSEFIDPQTHKITIVVGGALENQALGPLMSQVEMAKQGQLPSEVIDKLQQAKPLALAINLPTDIDTWLALHPNYPSLFNQAFGDHSLNLGRIAFAIATYERSLVADQTPWDMAMQSGQRMPYQENLGWEYFKQSGCNDCHVPPLFTDNKFYNVGIQGRNVDIGHQLISANKDDVGKMKVPSLRNVGLKTTFMHTGQFTTLDEVFEAYSDVPFADVASKLPNGDKYDFNINAAQQKAMIKFLTYGLTDPRVASEVYPFDRPKLRHEHAYADPSAIDDLTISLTEQNQPIMQWPNNVLKAGQDMQIVRNDGRHYWATQSPFVDPFSESGMTYDYTLSIRNGVNQHSATQTISINTPHTRWWLWTLLVIPMLVLVIYRKRF